MASRFHSTGVLLLLLCNSVAAANETESSVPSECDTKFPGECHNKAAALQLKLIAIAAILVASMLGVCLPLFSRSVPALRPDRDLFVVVKAFASGVILATGYMHVLPDSFDDLGSPCLPEDPWSKFPFTTFVAMLSAIGTLMLDSMMLASYNKRRAKVSSATATGHEMVPVPHGHGHCAVPQLDADGKDGREAVVLRNRIIAQVLEMGIIVHSVVIGLSMGASENVCTIRPLVAALCFPALRRNGPRRLHPSVRDEDERHPGLLLRGDHPVRGRPRHRAVQHLQRQQPDGARRGGPAERRLRGAAQLHRHGGSPGQTTSWGRSYKAAPGFNSGLTRRALGAGGMSLMAKWA
ncbi:unnamed protein product, partial [Musa textilis]